MNAPLMHDAGPLDGPRCRRDRPRRRRVARRRRTRRRLARRRPARARRWPPSTRTRWTAKRAFRAKRSTPCAASGCSPRWCRKRSAARACRSPMSPRFAKSSRKAAPRPRWCTRCTRSRWPASRRTAATRHGTAPARATGRTAMAARLGDLRGDHWRQYAHQRLLGRTRRRALAHRKARADHLLRRAGRRHSRHGTPHRRIGCGRPGADRRVARRNDAGKARRLGFDGHARHLQRGLSARRDGSRRADPADTVRRDRRPDHAADLAHAVGRGMDRHRHRRGRIARKRFSAPRRARSPARCRRPACVSPKPSACCR